MLLPPVCELCRHAGKAILDVYHSGDFTTDEKEDRSPLTQADLAAHRILVEGLTALHPSYPVLSEESRFVPPEKRRSWEKYWLVDPLDGTKEFLKRNGEFTVNVALVEKRLPVLGVVFAPALDRLYFAVRGGRAFRQDANSAAREIHSRAGVPPRVVGSRSHAGGHFKEFLDHLGEHSLVSMGSSLKICLVAEGEADVYPRLGPTSEWDTAAAQCVAEVAGASVHDLQGRQLVYNSRNELLNPFFVVSATPEKKYLQYLPAALRK